MLKPTSSWSFFPTANACSPASPTATTYIANINVIAQKADTLQTTAWLAGDTITTYFTFSATNYRRPEAIPAFLSTHNRIETDQEFNLFLNTPPAGNKRPKITVHLTMSDGTLFSFPDLEMRLK